MLITKDIVRDALWELYNDEIPINARVVAEKIGCSTSSVYKAWGEFKVDVNEANDSINLNQLYEAIDVIKSYGEKVTQKSLNGLTGISYSKIRELNKGKALY